MIKENLNFNSLPLQLLMLLTVSVSISSFPFSSSFQLAASGLAFQTLVPPGLCDACRRGLISRVKVYWFLTLSWATSGFVRLSSARCGEVKLLPVPVTQTTPQGGGCPIGRSSVWASADNGKLMAALQQSLALNKCIFMQSQKDPQCSMIGLKTKQGEDNRAQIYCWQCWRWCTCWGTTRAFTTEL